jgi:hypothetical protein
VPDGHTAHVRADTIVAGLRMITLAEHRKILNGNRSALSEKKWSAKLDANVGWADQTQVRDLSHTTLIRAGGVLCLTRQFLSLFPKSDCRRLDE